MTIRNLVRLTLIPACVATFLVGCSGGTTQDTVPTDPPLTAENTKAAAAKINAGLGATGKGGGIKAPGVNAPNNK